MANKSNHVIIPENPVSRFLFSDTRSGLIWLVIRVYLGWQWLHAGWGKVNNPKWVGELLRRRVARMLQAGMPPS
jgi:thiosulfate dehydrogenase [quinone] large subunit